MAAERDQQRGGDRPRSRRSEGTPAPSAEEIGALALDRVQELTSRQAVGVTAVEPAENGWLVDVEVVEERRIPSSSDMLALYEVELDPRGELLAYRRTRRYARGSGIDGRNEAS